ncbi:MAG: ArnT family glycosyltransferase [Planctomycetaceae bacterium]|jgi:4-amino-4-deoxy-L-arabinose transferase-like glycosyltransferase
MASHPAESLHKSDRSLWSRKWPWWLLGLAASVAVSLQLDPAGDHPGGWSGPGITTDEPLNVAQGVLLADRVFNLDLTGFRRVDAALPDYPPLGRVALGLGHEIAWMLWPPAETGAAYSIACARIMPALLFGVTVALVGWTAARRWGPAAGIWAGFSLVLMPRSFGHAHLASLETAINLGYLVTLLAALGAWDALGRSNQRLAPGNETWWWSARLVRSALWTGLALGGAWLIKIQAIFLLPVLAIWGLFWLRGRAVLWGLMVGGIAALVFVAGWPWLWDDPLGNARLYLGKTTARATIKAWYVGQPWADRDLPWHYPWVLWGTTVPLGLHLVGIWGVIQSARDWRKAAAESLFLLGLAIPLIVFSLPGIAVYDGERLFSIIFPLWALLIGRGAGAVAVCWHSKGRNRAVVEFVSLLLLVTQGWGLWALSPAWLSYYNAVAGGLKGAVTLGLPPSYWGDGLTRDLWREIDQHVPSGGTLALAPTLYESQAGEFQKQLPVGRQQRWTLVPFGTREAEQAEYVLLINRPEYLPPEYRNLTTADFVVSTTREGVWLSGLKRLDSSPPQP